MSNSGCTTGFMAFEDGIATTEGDVLRLHPMRGHLEYFGCSAESETGKPIDVSDETMDWSLAPSGTGAPATALTLVRQSDGVSSEFRKVD